MEWSRKPCQIEPPHPHSRVPYNAALRANNWMKWCFSLELKTFEMHRSRSHSVKIVQKMEEDPDSLWKTTCHPDKMPSSQVMEVSKIYHMCLLLLYLSQVEADMQGIDWSTQMNLSRKSLHEISKTPQSKQGHGIGYTFSSNAKNVPLNSQLFWDFKEILYKISQVKFTGFNRSVWKGA